MINADDEVSLAYLLEPTFQIENTAGKPLTDGWIEVYIHGTRSKYYCYSDWNGSLHPFKIPLDSLGSNIILASPAHSYDVYVYNKFGTLVMSRYNIVPATGDGNVIKDVVTIKSDDGTVGVTTSNQIDWDLSIKDTVDRVQHNEQEISNVKVDVENVTNNITNLTEVVNNHTTEIVQIKDDVANTNTDLTNLTKVVNNHTTEIGQIKVDVADIESSLINKKDKQPTKSFNGSATKTVKNISQNANGELTVEFEDIDLPQEVVQDANYVHTDNNFTNTDKSKLDNIQAGAEQNVQSDWNQTDSSADDYIKNKPSIPTKDSDLINNRYVSFDANNQGLTDTQMSNARTNIGAGTSNLELGDTAFTAAYGNHQHGRLQNNGSLGDENWSVSSGDRIVIAKAEFNGKRGYLAPSAITFISNEDSKALTQSAEWKEFLPPNGDGSSVSVTPDGTSTGYDIGSGTTLKVLAQKFKNLVNALKALAFKDKVSDSDINGTISDSHIASASTWSGKQSALATQTAYSAIGSATKVPQITTNSLGQVTGISEVTISGVTPLSHASTGITYGVGNTSKYGHVRLLNGDLNGKSYTDGVAAASAHTHGQYLTSHQSITTGTRNGSIAVSGRDVDVKGLGSLAYKSTIDTGDVSSGTYSINISGNSATSSSASRVLPYYTYIGEITNSTARHWQILKRTLSNSGDCINAVITVFIRSGKDTFLAYNVSFLIYRSGNSFVGKVFKTNIGAGDNSMTVTFNLIKTHDSNEVSVIASIAASTSSTLYISGYATATLVEWANFVTKNNTGNTIADIVGPGYSNIASA